MEMEPQVALITGAGSGMGRQLVLDLCRRGWKVAGVDQNPLGLEELEQGLAAEQRDFAWAVADVTESASLAEEIGKLEARLGPIDLLIASAGVWNETHAVGMNAASIARIVGINLVGVSNTIAAVLPGMLARRQGHIAAISSLASYRGLPGQMGYCASKAGLNALMESLWLDVKSHGILVTTICPGHTRTPQAIGVHKDACLMPVETAASKILRAIDRRKRFQSFPWTVVAQLRLLRWLPMRLQEWLLLKWTKSVKAEEKPFRIGAAVPQREFQKSD